MEMTASEMGRKGAAAKYANMTAEERSAASRKAVKARWARTTPEERSEYARHIRSFGTKKKKGKKKREKKARK